MLRKKIPVQMISIISTTGEITPLKFRFEDMDHAIQTVEITQTLGKKEDNAVGHGFITFICKAVKDERETLVEMTYYVRSHRWELSDIYS